MGQAAEERGADNRPQLADVGRLGRRLLRRVVSAARAEEKSIWRLRRAPLGADALIPEQGHRPPRRPRP